MKTALKRHALYWASFNRFELRLSDEAVDEAILANDYEFLADGTRSQF